LETTRKAIFLIGYGRCNTAVSQVSGAIVELHIKRLFLNPESGYYFSPAASPGRVLFADILI
jgi:hypothetical protein